MAITMVVMFADTIPRRRGRRTAPGARRQHGQSAHHDRTELEASGWRTTLEYRENLVRSRDGCLEHLEVVWQAEAERQQRDGTTQVVSASGSTQSRAWSRLRAEADLADVRRRRAAVAGI